MSLPDGAWQDGFEPHIADDGDRAAFLRGAEVGMVWATLVNARAEAEIATAVGVENVENVMRLAEWSGRQFAVSQASHMEGEQELIGIEFSPVGAFRQLNYGWVEASS